MKKFSLFIFVVFWFITSKSQNQDSILFNAYKSIQSDDLKAIVHTLASPEMGGRGLGTKGIIKASDYIKKSFQQNNIGYLPKLEGYFQSVDFSNYRLDTTIISIGEKNYLEYEDFIGSLSTFHSNKAINIIICRDISIENIQKIDFTGCVILILTEDIFFIKQPIYDLLIKKGCTGVMICNPFSKKQFHDLSLLYSPRKGKWKDKLKASFSGNILKTDSLLNSLKYKDYYLSTIIIHPKVASRFLGLRLKTLVRKLELGQVDSNFNKIFQSTISIQKDIIKTSQISNNVIGFIEGSDLKDEVVVISAHYDHLGAEDGKIFYGADDNASGVAAVLEIAQAYSIAVKNGFRPKRSILFAAFTAEEQGLWGSRVFINKIDGLSLKPIVNLNADMIGRGEDSRMEFNNKVKKVFATAEKKDSLLIKKIMQIHMGEDSLRLDYSSKDKYSSDQASFMYKGYSAVLFFRGLHPDYHTELDTPNKLDYETMEKISRLIFRLSIEYSK